MRSIEPDFCNNLPVVASDSAPRLIDLTQHVMSFDPVSPGEEALRVRYVEVSQKHRDLDDTIARLCDAGERDELLIARLKKRKLQTRDEITQLERQLQHAADLAGQNRSGQIRLQP